MKRIVLISMLALLTLPIFAQTDDPYTKFQGVWWGEADGGDWCHFIFSNNNLTMIGKDIGKNIICFGNYFIDKNTIVYNIKSVFSEDNDDGWLMVPEKIAPLDIPDTMAEFQYVFSGDRLILIADGYPISLQRPKKVDY
jgi:hypothetical protein